MNCRRIITMWEIQTKVEELRRSVRKEQLGELMGAARRSLMREEEEAEAREIASRPPSQLTPEHLRALLRLVNADVPLALVALGNLVVDRFLGAQELQACEWRVGGSEYWPWLIHAFAEVGFCTAEMLDFCVRRVIARRSALSLEHALEVLLASLRLAPAALARLRRPDLLLALANHALEGGDRLPQLALSVFSALTSEDEAMPALILESLGATRTEEVLLVGLLKVQAATRALACQIAHNFLLSGFGLARVRARLLELAAGEKERVKLELSYYFKALAEQAPEDALLASIRHHHLLALLHAYSRAAEQHPRLGPEIADNAARALAAIRRRFHASSGPTPAPAHHIEKSLEDGEDQTIYEDESARMIE